MKTLVVLPSYNEKENLPNLVKTILNLRPDSWTVVVDDNSPDGTAKAIESLKAELPADQSRRLHLIVRSKKDGRGGAVREGLKWGLQNSENFEAFVEMDCDFSHPPTDIEKGVGMLKDADMVMGSRYPHGEIIGWPLKRRVFSFFANQLARTLIDWKISDFTNGYRFYNRRAAEFICKMPQQYKGYIYLSETISYLLRAGFRLDSFPIVFVNRQRGESNTNLGEISHALKGVFKIGWEHRTQNIEKN
ncbi:MAG: glycosyltransferase [Bdellovibrionales bacterium]